MKINAYQQNRLIASGCEIQDKTEITMRPVAGQGTAVVKLSVPIRDMHCYWIPDLRLPSQKLHWVINLKSSAAKNFPLISFFNLAGRNVCTVALDELTGDIEIVARMNQETGCYDLTVTVGDAPSARAIRVMVDCRPVHWQQALAEWRSSLDVVIPEFPEGAWHPVYCTWYAVHASVTQDWVERNAAIASGMGIKTLIIDDGWCFDQMKRVSPETLPVWYEMIGDWELSTVKFPDFPNHVKRVREMGMKYLLWVTPALIGVKSKIYQRVKELLSPEYVEGCHKVDPSHREVTMELAEKIGSLVDKYGLDGLKVDFIDYFRIDPEKPAGYDALACVAALSERIRRNCPDALIEFRQLYSTIGMIPYATQFRAGDVPFDFIDNFNRLAQLRLTLGDGIPIHADPSYWRNDELPVNISRHMIASMVGVPMLSMDLTAISPEAMAIVRHWLEFYAAHLDTFRRGRWQIEYSMSDIRYVAAETDSETVIIVSDATSAAAAAANRKGTVWLLNLSSEKLSLPECAGFDELGRGAGADIIPGGYGRLG